MAPQVHALNHESAIPGTVRIRCTRGVCLREREKEREKTERKNENEHNLKAKGKQRKEK